MNIKKILASTGAAAAIFGFAAVGAFAANFSNGFETNTDGWLGSITQVASGSNSIDSYAGSYHAEVADSSVFTRWGGYNYGAGDAIPTAFQEYKTSLYVYLDVDGGWANDTRFDFTSAINKSDGTHLRDFIFNAGFYNDATGPGANTDRFVISASYNSQPGSAYAKNPGFDPIAISDSGWYKFEHHFYDNSGTLAVDMSIYDKDGNLVKTWNRGGDPIAGVGGNRYGWFDYSQFPYLAIDETQMEVVLPFVRYAEILSPTSGEVVSGNVSFDAILYDEDGDDNVQWAVRKGTCAAGQGTVYGNVDGFHDAYSWDGETFNSVADTSMWENGDYCFVFNPTETSGVDTAIRETQEFVVANPPYDMNQCKKGGWESFTNPTFKNQGDCVSYVQSNEHATGNRKDN